MTETPAQDEILTYPEAAAVLKVAVSTLHHLVMKEEVPSFKVGGARRFSRNALLALARTDEKAAG